MNLPPDALVITRRDIARAMSLGDFREAVELAFRAAAAGRANSPAPMHLPAKRGAFHAKGATLSLDRHFAALKLNGNFPGNPDELGLPTIQGAIILADAGNGALLAVIDSAEVTLRRTAAASALAARLLARPDSRTLLVCGCGEQGRAHLEALSEVLPLHRFRLWDANAERAEQLAAEWRKTEPEAVAVAKLNEAALAADVIACCTSATTPFLDVPMVRPGTFVAAVGADNPDKSEIAPALMAAARVVTDVTAQCAAMGDLHHAIAAGAMSADDVHAQLAEVLVGARPGRTLADEVVIFDSTGTGLQDVASAAAIHRRCLELGIGQAVAFAAP